MSDESTVKAKAARERLDEEVERIKRRGLPPLPPREIERGVELCDISETLQRVTQRAHEIETARRRLPCFAPTEAGEDELGVDACEAARAYENCGFVTTYALCPRLRSVDVYAEATQRLATAGIAEVERGLLLAAVQRKDRRPLLDTDALQVVRAVLRRKRACVMVENAAVIRHDGGCEYNEVNLTGTERLIVLAGAVGRGKTVAASYAIGKMGGLYTVAGQWARPSGVDIAWCKRARVLVVDQLGREYAGEHADFMRAQLEEVLDDRYANRRLTFCVGNIEHAAFVARYDKVLVDRVQGGGVFVLFGGPSLRAPARQRELRSSP